MTSINLKNNILNIQKLNILKEPSLQNMSILEKSYKNIVKFMNERNYKLLTPLEEFKGIKYNIVYICNCSEEKTRKFKNIRDKKDCECRKCKSIRIKNENNTYQESINDDEIWKKIKNGWVSNKGRYKNDNNTITKLYIDNDHKNGRYKIGDSKYSASALIYVIFKKENYEYILHSNKQLLNIIINKNEFDIVENNNDNYTITFINNTYDDYNLVSLDNMIVKKYNDIIDQKLERINTVNSWNFDQFHESNISIIKQLRNYIIYDNGEIYNILKNKYEPYTVENKEYVLIVNNNRYSVSKLILIAFRTNEGKYENYNNIYIKYKDDNKLNNNINNLEWTTTLNIRKTRGKKIDQFSKDNIFLRRYNTITEAINKKDDKEITIRNMIKNKPVKQHNYIWKLFDEEI